MNNIIKVGVGQYFYVERIHKDPKLKLVALGDIFDSQR
jgi:hypothetical protein